MNELFITNALLAVIAGVLWGILYTLISFINSLEELEGREDGKDSSSIGFNGPTDSP